MILLIDNYDSFSYNLVQMCGVLNPDIRVIRNDEMTVEEIENLHPTHIILSPGPGYPRDAGICEEAVKKLGPKIPILGVCLGHQGICEVFGAEIVHAPRLMHGKQSTITVTEPSILFEEVPKQFKAARYHSLTASLDRFPEELMVTAVGEQGEIMAVQHRNYPVYGLQFHPESIMTPKGSLIMKKFLEV